MGGRIWAKDLPQGGAEFGFTIPAYDEEAELDLEPDESDGPGFATPTSVATAPASLAASPATNGAASPTPEPQPDTREPQPA